MNPQEHPAVAVIRRRRVLRLAYESANRHISQAGLGLASAGVRPDSPEMRAIDFALRTVNRAGGIETPKPPSPMKEFRYEPPPRRVRPGPGQDESVA